MCICKIAAYFAPPGDRLKFFPTSLEIAHFQISAISHDRARSLVPIGHACCRSRRIYQQALQMQDAQGLWILCMKCAKIEQLGKHTVEESC